MDLGQRLQVAIEVFWPWDQAYPLGLLMAPNDSDLAGVES